MFSVSHGQRRREGGGRVVVVVVVVVEEEVVVEEKEAEAEEDRISGMVSVGCWSKCRRQQWSGSIVRLTWILVLKNYTSVYLGTIGNLGR
jgi:hypothetical protein